jgi:hypothetical protein
MSPLAGATSIPNGTISSSLQITQLGFQQTSSAVFNNLLISQSMVREWSVVNNANIGYTFTPTNDPTLESGEDMRIWVRHGDTIVFNVVAASHPFYLKTSVTSGTGNQVSGVSNNGATNGQVVYNTSGSAVNTTIYYVSSNNTALSGEIVILDRERKTQIGDGRLVHTGSIIIDGGLVVSGSTYLTGSIYLNGAPLNGGGGGGGIFLQTGSFFNTSNNVGITGSLVISGSVTASSFSVTSPGTPQLYSATNLNLNAGNAVVITSSSLRLASFTSPETASFTPQVGDMYYNTSTNKFMGYIANNWIDFTSGSSVGGAGGSGTSGTSGTSGVLSLTGTTYNGVVTYTGTSGAGQVSSGLKYEPLASKTEVSASLHITAFMNIAPTNPLPTGILVTAGTFAVSASGAVYKPYFYDGSAWNALY